MLHKVEGTQAKCSCGETLYFLFEDSEPALHYRVQHGERPEVVSPLINGPAGERSMEWREKVHAYLGAAEVLRGMD